MYPRTTGPRNRYRVGLCNGLLALFALACSGSAWSERAASGPIIKCTTKDKTPQYGDKGSSRNCDDKPPTVISDSGTPQGQATRTESPNESIDREKKENDALLQCLAKQSKRRHDLALLDQYKNEGALRRARDSALAPPRAAQVRAKQRLAELAAKRKLLDDEAEFYRGKQMPQKLIDAFRDNDGMVAAQAALLQHAIEVEAEEDQKYNRLLEDLKPLWAKPYGVSAVQCTKGTTAEPSK